MKRETTIRHTHLPATAAMADRREGKKRQRFICVPLCLPACQSLAGRCASVPIFVALMFLFLTPLYARMEKAQDSQEVEQKAFFKKYSGKPAKGRLIKDVPFYKQNQRNYCGPAVLSMVLNYWDKDKSFTQEEIVEDTFDPDVEITNNSEMVFYPYVQDFCVYSFNGDMEKIKTLVKENIPVIVLQRVVDKIVNKGHYRVVVGYDDAKNVMILNDPWFGDKLSMSYKLFSQLWAFGEEINKKNWALVILPKEKESILDKPGMKESALTYHNIATAFYSRNKIDEAIREWKKAIEISPEEITFYYCLSYAYIQQENYDEAIRYGKLAVEMDDNNSFAYDTLGWAYYKKGMLKEAFQELEKAAQLSPNVEFIKEHYNIVAEEISRK